MTRRPRPGRASPPGPVDVDTRCMWIQTPMVADADNLTLPADPIRSEPMPAAVVQAVVGELPPHLRTSTLFRLAAVREFQRLDAANEYRGRCRTADAVAAAISAGNPERAFSGKTLLRWSARFDRFGAEGLIDIRGRCRTANSNLSPARLAFLRGCVVDLQERLAALLREIEGAARDLAANHRRRRRMGIRDVDDAGGGAAEG